MPHNRSLKSLNGNPDKKQKPVDPKTGNAVFSYTENDATDWLMLERSSMNVQLTRQEKPVKQMEREALIKEQEIASTSSVNHLLDVGANLELASINNSIEPVDPDLPPPIGLCTTEAASDTVESCFASTSAAAAANKDTGPLTLSSNNFIADLHEKLYSSHMNNKKSTLRRSNRYRSQSSDIDDTLPQLSAIVNEILSLEADFPVPSTSFAEHSNAEPTVVRSSKRNKRQHKSTAAKYSKRTRKVIGNLASSLPGLCVHNVSSNNTLVLSDSEDSDCEITGYVPCNSQSAHCRKSPELNVFDQSILDLNDIPLPPPLEQSSEVGNCTSKRLHSIINMLSDSIQRVDDDVMIVDARQLNQGGSEQTITNLDRSVIETVTTNRSNQQLPPVIVVSDDESDTTVKPASNTQLKSIASKLSPEQEAASSNGSRWECPICWEELSSVKGVYATVCGHIFCKPCMFEVLKTSKLCPNCRSKLSKKKVHPLFVNGW